MRLQRERRRGYVVENNQRPFAERIVITSILRYTNGAANIGGDPCGKCGRIFVNVVCPIGWPVDTVALVCATCGSTVEYLDGLLLFNVRQALRENRGMAQRGHVEARPAASNVKVLRELIQMGVDNKMTHLDIAEALEVEEQYVKQVAENL